MLQLLQAYAGPGRTALSFAPTYSMYPEYARDTNTDWVVGHREEDFSLDLDHAGTLIERHRPAVVLLPSPNNPTGTALPHEAIAGLCEAAGDGLVVLDEAYGEFRRAGVPERARAASRAPQPRGHPHHEQGVRARRRPARLPGRRPGDLRRHPRGPAAVPPLRGHAGGRAGRAAPREGAARPGRRPARRAGRDRRPAARAGSRGRGERREFRVVRRLPGSSCCLAGAARPGRPRARGRTGRVAAGVDRHPGRDEVVHTGAWTR